MSLSMTTRDVQRPGGPGTILFATDFSAKAQAALNWAVFLARTHGAHLHLVHALRPVNGLPHPSDLVDGVQRFALDQLRALALDVGLDPAQIYWATGSGRAFEVIREQAVAIAADLIVAGTEGRTGLRHLFLRSTAERVLPRAPCPVLAVHEGARWQNRGPRTLLIPTDFSEIAELAVRQALEIFGGGDSGSSLTLLHVRPIREDYAYDVWRLGSQTEGTRRSCVDSLTRRLEELAEPLRRGGRTVRTLLREGSPPEVVSGVALEVDADLIAMGSHGRSGLSHLFLGSVAERIVQHAPCPVLVVPELRARSHLLGRARGSHSEDTTVKEV